MWTFSFDSTSPSLLPALILTGLVLVFWYALNLVTYTFFQADKERAIHGESRISERTLLLLALSGGSIGAKIAQRRFYHKTQKQPFGRILNSIVAAHLALVALAVYFAIAGTPYFWAANQFASFFPT
ncbi:MAG: DUF1294 domain-containing protein [Shimia sp.]|nr:DUF1294 domain-containing protein [Shimia sp.]MCP4826534.1 DUF1294 domain-containing protein [Shimia sp.]